MRSTPTCTGLAAEAHPTAVSSVRSEEEGVVHLPRRMLRREVERGEVVEVVLDVGPFGDRETHLREDGDHLVHRAEGGVERAGPRRGGGGRVRSRALGGELGVERGGFQGFASARGDGGLDGVAQAVDLRPSFAALVRAHGRRATSAGRRWSPACRAPRHAHGLERGEVGGGGDARESMSAARVGVGRTIRMTLKHESPVPRRQAQCRGVDIWDPRIREAVLRRTRRSQNGGRRRAA